MRGVGVIGIKALWGAQEHLLASVADGLTVANAMFANSHRRKGSPTVKPTLIKRPGFEDAEDVKRTKGDALPLDEMLEIQRRWARGEFHDGE